MALTITWDEYNGVGETKSDSITAITLGSTDASDFTISNFPITAGDASFGKYIKVDFANMAGEGVTEVQNTRIHKSAGAYKTLEDLTFEGLGPVSYATPSEVDLADTTIPTSLPGAQNLALSGSDSGVLVADGQSDYGRFQTTTDASTENGALNAKTITVTYDTI